MFLSVRLPRSLEKVTTRRTSSHTRSEYFPPYYHCLRNSELAHSPSKDKLHRVSWPHSRISQRISQRGRVSLFWSTFQHSRQFLVPGKCWTVFNEHFRMLTCDKLIFKLNNSTFHLHWRLSRAFLLSQRLFTKESSYGRSPKAICDS